MILHVGRFVGDRADVHHKGQGCLLDVFLRMKRAHAAGWQLHFVGSAAGDPASRDFVAGLVGRAQGSPVLFHFDAPFPRLVELYRRAAVYWHATGFGTDPGRDPIKQEHFGISTVEAMSAGAVPVVIDTAGQKESVIHGQSGFLWGDLEQLRAYTEQVIADGALRGRLALAAREAARAFGREAFGRRLDQLLEQLGSAPA
jgi:glycosyltransferase involved in cell wall biosynthesis